MSPPAIRIRRMQARDLPAVARIQAACPEASQWPPRDYLAYAAIVVQQAGRLAGFAAARAVPPDELEILNLAVAPAARRRGLGRALLEVLLALPGRILYLEVRASNAPARALYASAGFVEAGVRKGYYAPLQDPNSPPEDAIVMKMQKW
jgi:ribosomal-protein-alanine N-acetyltransferase